MSLPQNSDNTPVISSEETAEIESLEAKVLGANLPQELKTKSLNMLNRLKRLAKYGYFSKEFEPVEKYIGWITRIPWNKSTEDNLDLGNVKRQLDSTHFGLEGVKERLLEYVAMLNLLSNQEKFLSGTPTREESNKIYLEQKESQAKVLDSAPSMPTQQVNESGVIDIHEKKEENPEEIIEEKEVDSAIESAARAVLPPGAKQEPQVDSIQNMAKSPEQILEGNIDPKTATVIEAEKAAPESPTKFEVDLKNKEAISRAPVICFVGVQGIGKTSIAKSIAAALNRQFIRIPLGGLANVTELRGVVTSEPNAEPGQIIKAFIRSGVMNPLILLDEIDKVSKENSVQADVMAVLLEILDPEQNYAFRDHYLDFPVDLSKCVFICTANNLGGISAALLDRLEIIRMISYTDEEKINIARHYLLPKVMSDSGLTNDNIIFDDDVWPLVIRPLGFDAGIRQLERTLRMFVRKIAKKIVLNEGKVYRVTKDNFKEYIPLDIGVFS